MLRISQIVLFQTRQIATLSLLGTLLFVSENRIRYAPFISRFSSHVVWHLLIPAAVLVGLLLLARMLTVRKHDNAEATGALLPDDFHQEMYNKLGFIVEDLRCVATSRSDFRVEIADGEAKKGAPTIYIEIPGTRVDEIAVALKGGGSSTNTFLYIIGHELGHVVYRDHSRLSLMIANILGAVFILVGVLLPLISSSAPSVDRLEYNFFLVTMPTLGIILSILGLGFSLRLGEYYADRFAADLLNQATVSEELGVLMRREKYIRYSLGHWLTHPSFGDRFGRLRNPEGAVTSLILASAIALAHLGFYTILMPSYAVSGVVSSGWFLIFFGYWGIAIMGVICSIVLFWLIFILIAPICFLCFEVILNSSRQVATYWMCFLAAGIAIVWVLANFIWKASQVGAPEVIQTAVMLGVRVWLDGVAAATIMAIAISWWLAMRGGSPAEDLRIRRDVVLGMCYILFVAIVSWIGFLLDGPRVGATTAVACVIAGIGLVLARGPIGDAPERSTTLAQTGKESRLFGSDIAVLRFIERFVLTLLFWAPASVIYAAIENQPDAEEFSFQLLIIFLVYRAIKASQRKEIRVNSLIARLISVTSLGDQSQRTRLMTV